MSNSGGGGGSNAPTYPVPWKVYKATTPPADGLVLYWFPATENELKNSSLKESRTLSLYAKQCVAMEVADTRIANAEKLVGDSQLPIAVLATPDGTPVKKIENTNGKLKVIEVEKVVEGEMKQRENGLTEQINEAARKVKAGDNDGAIKIYKAVVEQKCLFPKKAKDAAKDKDVRIGGGVATIQQYLRAGLIDELHLAIRPILMGSGENLFAGIDLRGLGYQCTEHVSTALATHVVLTKRAIP